MALVVVPYCSIQRVPLRDLLVGDVRVARQRLLGDHLDPERADRRGVRDAVLEGHGAEEELLLVAVEADATLDGHGISMWGGRHAAEHRVGDAVHRTFRCAHEALPGARCRRIGRRRRGRSPSLRSPVGPGSGRVPRTTPRQHQKVGTGLVPNLSLSSRASTARRRPRWATARCRSALLVVTLLTAIDQTIVATALPTIVDEVGGRSGMGWVFAGYTLAMTATMPIYGRLGDLQGRRRLFLGCLLGFVAASALCGVATSMAQLVALRAMQGVAGGGVLVLSQAVVADAVRPGTGSVHGTGRAGLRRLQRPRPPGRRLADRDGGLALDLLGQHPAGCRRDRAGGPLGPPPDRPAGPRASRRPRFGAVRRGGHRPGGADRHRRPRAHVAVAGRGRGIVATCCAARCSSPGCSATTTRSSRSACCGTGSS